MFQISPIVIESILDQDEDTLSPMVLVVEDDETKRIPLVSDLFFSTMKDAQLD